MLFWIIFPIYRWLHQERAYGRVVSHLKTAGLSELTSADEVFKGIYWSAIDSYRILLNIPNAVKRISIENDELLKEALKAGPAVAMSVHQGSFEILHRILCDYGAKVHVITNPLHNSSLSKCLDKIRSRENLQQYAVGDPNMVSTLIKNTIRTKGILAMLVDQSREGKGNTVSLFGQSNALYLRLPLRMNQMGASIVTFHTYHRYEDNGNKRERKIIVRFEKCYPPLMAASADGEQSLIAGIAAEIQDWLTDYPEQWCWNYHRNFRID